MNMLKSLILSFLFSTSLIAQVQHKFAPMTWNALQKFQIDSLLPAETFNLDARCPNSLDTLKADYSSYPTTIKKILGSFFIWTEFYNTEGEICVVKHLKLESLNSKPINPKSYMILSTLESRILLSAAVSFGFKDKGISNHLLENELIKIRNHNNLISKEQLRMYGGLKSVYEYMDQNKPFIKVEKFKFKNDLAEGSIYNPTATTQVLHYFEKNYSTKQKQVLLSRIKNRVYSKSDLAFLENYWSLVSIQIRGSPRKNLLDNSNYQIHFDKDILRFSGNIDCNKFSGRFSFENDIINLYIGLTTQKGCLHYPVTFSTHYSEKIGREISTSTNNPKEFLHTKQTDLIKDIISDVVGYEIKNNELILFTKDARKLFFK